MTYKFNRMEHEGKNRNVLFHFASRFGRQFSCERIFNVPSDKFYKFSYAVWNRQIEINIFVPFIFITDLI
jgi:hypothetical protein